MAIKNNDLEFKIMDTQSWAELVTVLFENDAMNLTPEEALKEYKEKMIDKYGRIRFKFKWMRWDDKETIQALEGLVNGH